MGRALALYGAFVAVMVVAYLPIIVEAIWPTHKDGPFTHKEDTHESV